MKSPDFRLFEVDARALESLILSRKPPIEAFGKRAGLAPGTYARLLDEGARRTFRAITIRRVMRALGIEDPRAIVVGLLDEEDLKVLKVPPKAVKKREDLGELYSRQSPGGKPTWRLPAARRRDLRRNPADEEAM
jgi:hypothetical protein